MVSHQLQFDVALLARPIEFDKEDRLDLKRNDFMVKLGLRVP